MSVVRTKHRRLWLAIGALALTVLALVSLDLAIKLAPTPEPSRRATDGAAAQHEEGESSTPSEPAELLFASDYADGLSEFPFKIHRERISVVDDPVLGSERKVLKLEVHNDDTGPTENPRAQLETPYDFEEGDDRYLGFSYYFPSSFPAELPSEAWIALGSIAYGPPFDGAGPLSIRVQNDVDGNGAVLRWQRGDAYDNDIPWTGPQIADIRGRWVDFVVRTRLHSDPDIGLVELWMNTGSGWERQELNGQDHVHVRTYDDANSGGPNNSRIGLYYRKDIPGPLTMYQGPIRIAAAGEGAFAMVAPESYR